MIVKSIRHLDALKIHDDVTGTVYYGCDQEWYQTVWQRRSGCGPTTSTTILQYLHATRMDDAPALLTKSCCLKYMEDVWKYVTPGPQGISSTQKLCQGLKSYAQAKSIHFQINVLDIPRDRNRRPAFAETLAFLDAALEKDLPIAFLNLHNGNERILDAWHWVTIVSIQHEPDSSVAFAGILDEGMRKTIDFTVWFHTTLLGGGLVSFDFL